MKTKFIYCLICPKTNVIKYIGKSKNPIKRFRSHLSKNNLLESTKKNNWLVSLLRENLIPIMEIIDEVSEKEIDYWERFYIQLFRSWGFELLNGTEGGDGYDWTGRKHSDYSKFKNKINSPSRKSIAQFDLNGNLIGEYLSLREAGQITGINKSHISRVCRGIQKTSGGYIWKFIDRINVNGENHIRDRVLDFEIKCKFSTLKKVSVYKLDGELVEICKSVNDASEKFNCHRILVKKCCEEKGYYQTKNLTFRYFGDPFDYFPYKYYRDKKNYRIGKFDRFGNIVEEFDSLREASKQTGIGKQYISRNCKSNQLDSVNELKGFIFKFLKDVLT